MFFSKLARVLAVIALVFGLLSALLGTMAVTMGTWDEATLARYGSPWRMIDRGIYVILAAAALGTVAEISFSMGKRTGPT